jgi:hypothetical protein
MANPTGDAFRTNFLELLATQGTDCHAGGELRRTLIEENKHEGYTVFKSADEFAIQPGDTIKNWATAREFEVIDAQPVSRGGAFHHFEVAAT